ncbi:hypothetical protein GCM10010521_16120 [Streptomyces rameus]|uniref:Uncharacterized protein n=1 Tax=Streptomyces rameus TaxID=68261 RepID=A0ABP6MZI4_9ACTN
MRGQFCDGPQTRIEITKKTNDHIPSWWNGTKTARDKYGHLQYGSWGYKVPWEKYRRRGDGCNGGTLVDSGTATLPTKETGWRYWETSS